ncbi:hypothetical protein E2562_019090 [Oryza meyeriana var. granulata]|uniref:Uncharacterized protein n=1 Tax=Oryza meyeriana var. granulata TaxID=110450 RepID=A0A6G1CRP7_9ORYZ|nr:hypothetical protein E2562_019090 [Oryza meyeriana var. granulata]
MPSSAMGQRGVEDPPRRSLPPLRTLPPPPTRVLTLQPPATSTPPPHRRAYKEAKLASAIPAPHPRRLPLFLATPTPMSLVAGWIPTKEPKAAGGRDVIAATRVRRRSFSLAPPTTLALPPCQWVASQLPLGLRCAGADWTEPSFVAVEEKSDAAAEARKALASEGGGGVEEEEDVPFGAINGAGGNSVEESVVLPPFEQSLVATDSVGDDALSQALGSKVAFLFCTQPVCCIASK